MLIEMTYLKVNLDWLIFLGRKVFIWLSPGCKRPRFKTHAERSISGFNLFSKNDGQKRQE